VFTVFQTTQIKSLLLFDVAKMTESRVLATLKRKNKGIFKRTSENICKKKFSIITKLNLEITFVLLNQIYLQK